MEVSLICTRWYQTMHSSLASIEIQFETNNIYKLKNKAHKVKFFAKMIDDVKQCPCTLLK